MVFGRGPRHRVVVYTRDGCHLCDDAIDFLRRQRRRRRLDIALVDIAGDTELEARWGEKIPVVEIDGTARFFGLIDPVLFDRLF